MTKYPFNLDKGDMIDRYDLLWENEDLTVDPQYRSVRDDRLNDYKMFYVLYYACFPSDNLTMSTMVVSKHSFVKREGAREDVPGVGYPDLFQEYYPYRMVSYAYGRKYYRDVTMYRLFYDVILTTPYFIDALKFSPLYNSAGVVVDESKSEQKYLVPYRIYGIR